MTISTPSGPAAVTTTGPLAVFADVRVDIEGHRAHLVGDGQSLILHTDQPLHLWSALAHAPLPAGVGRVNGPRALGRAADALRAAGLTVDVTGPDGVLVRLGGAGTSAGRLLTGSSAVGLGSTRVVTSTLNARVPVGRISLAAALVAAMALAVAVIVRRRR